MPVPLVRRPWFWIALILLSAGSAALAFRLFPKAFPLVSLDIRMDRAHAIRAARELALAKKWGPPDSVRDVASFGSDGSAQAFIELEGGGKSAFVSLLHDDLFSPYAWSVRLFKESETNQTTVRFKPGGEPYGFDETLRQNAPGAALAADAARLIAERAAAGEPWRIPLARFKLVESSQVKRPGGRIDHTFVYERPDRQLGEGRLRLSLVVGGDRLTALAQFVKIPEAFTRRYEQMRSANNAIAIGASIAVLLLYIIGGCGGGFVFLMRQRAVLWRQPLAWAAVISGLQLLAAVNAWPLAWLGYDTALSAGGFVTERIVLLLAGTLGMGFVLFLSFLAAEGLTRRAFPQQPQLWRLWSRDAAPSPAILGRTLGGYLWAAVSLLYVTVFYFFLARKLGWWTPAEALVDPDLLSHYQPWLTPFATAAQAGFWEESLFRAVPLAGAALLGSRFGGRRWWIAGAFVLQALVFSAAHANYPGQPAYSRLVELLVPSCFFGGAYLLFGLLPAILIHFTYDVALMSLPLFASSANGIWIDRTLVALLSLVPLWIVLWRRWRAGAWREFPTDLRNAGWQPPDPPAITAVTLPPVAATSAVISNRLRVGVLAAAVAGLVAWIAATPFYRLGPPLEASRTEAIATARAELARRGVKLDEKWQVGATVLGRNQTADRFAWQTAGRAGYEALLGTYVPNTLWRVRFFTFEGDVAERAEEWNVYLNGQGGFDGISHQLPEARAGATLTQAEARERAHAAIREKWKIDPASLKEISATSAKRPKRLDWTFVFRDPAVKSLATGQARLQVELAGDEVTTAYRFVFTPEDWERADRALQSAFRTGSIVNGIVFAVIVIAGICVALVAWSRKKFAVRVAVTVFCLLVVASLIGTANRWPATTANFSTAQPLDLQRTIALVGPLVGALIVSASLALIAGLVVRWLRAPIADARRATTLAIGASLAAAGGVALVALLHLNTDPSWPPLGAPDTFIPLFAPTLAVVLSFTSQTAITLLVFGTLDRMTTGWQKRRAPALGLAFLVGVALSLDAGGPSVAAWLVAAAASSAIVVAVYFFVFRHDLTMLPLAKAVSVALTTLAAGLPRAWAGALPASLLAALTCLALGWWGTAALRKIAAARVG